MAFRNPVRSIPADRIIGRINGTTQIEPGSITTPSLAAGTVTTDRLAANAIDGMLVTGAVLRTAATGNRVLISGEAGGTDVPGVALHSGHTDETEPGIVRSDTVTVGPTVQPFAEFAAPRADGGTANLSLTSPAGTGHGDFTLNADSDHAYCYVSGIGGTLTSSSAIELHAENGGFGGLGVVQVTGGSVYLDHDSSRLTIDGDTDTVTVENAALVGPYGTYSEEGEWEPVTFSQWKQSTNATYQTLRCSRGTKRARLDGCAMVATAIAAGGTQTVCTLPEGMWPLKAHYYDVPYVTSTSPALLGCRVGADGVVTIWSGVARAVNDMFDFSECDWPLT